MHKSWKYINLGIFRAGKKVVEKLIKSILPGKIQKHAY